MSDKQRSRALAFLGAAVFASCAAVAPGLSRHARGETSPQTEGALWLSWSAQTRNAYVAGYLHGFQQGKRVACSFYEQMVAPEGFSGPLEKLPSHVCLQHLPELTEPYYHAYVDRITDYYRKYPNDREVGLSQLMTYLATPPSLSIDEIHAKLAGEPKGE